MLARTTVPGPVPPPAEVSNVVEAVFGPEGYGGLTHDLNAALQSAQSVRDRIDEDALRVLYEIPEQHRLLSGRTPIEHQHLDALITALVAFSGILTETMIRGQSFAFFEIGRRLERALGLCCHPAGHAPARPFAPHPRASGSRPRCGPRRASSPTGAATSRCPIWPRR